HRDTPIVISLPPWAARRRSARSYHDCRGARTPRKGFAMSNQELTQTAKQIITSYSTSNWTALKNLAIPDVIYNEIGTQRRIKGADAMIQSLQDWKKAMTDS